MNPKMPAVGPWLASNAEFLLAKTLINKVNKTSYFTRNEGI